MPKKASIPYTYQDKHGTYYVRFVFPKEVRARCPELGRDIRRSLQTKFPRQARMLSSIAVNRWWMILKQMDMSRYRNKKFYLDLIRAPITFESSHEGSCTNLNLVTACDPLGNPVTIDFGDPDKELAALQALQREWIKDHERLVRLKAEFEGAPGKQAAVEADFIRAYPTTGTESPDFSVEQVIDVFIREKSKSVGEQTLDELRPGLEMFKEFVGDTPFNRIDESTVREFKELIPQVPAQLSRNKSLSSLPLREVVAIAAAKGHKLLAEKTVLKRIESVRQLLEWAAMASEFIQRDLSKVLARKYVDTTANRGKQEYKAFTSEHLQNLLNSYLYRGDFPARLKKIEPHKFWVPLIAMFSGARLEEVCQLWLSDFDYADGLPFFRITDEGDNRSAHVKTKSSRRPVPIHPVLVEAGLLEYVNELRTAGEERLFPELDNNNQKRKYSFNVTKWFGDTLRKEIGYKKGQGYCIHSFRKLVVQRLQNDTTVPREVRKAIVGHSIGGGDSHEDYEGEYSIKVLHENLGKLKYPEIEFVGVSWQDFCERRQRWINRCRA